METLLEIILTPNAPEPIGPYSQAVKSRDFLFCSGQIAIDPKTGAMVQSSVEEETKQVMKNIRAVLEANGATFANVVKTTIFLTNMGDFAAMNKIYEVGIGTSRPARTTVQVAALPKGARVEIECIASLA
ncbi:MAG TPA: RidA family protein [Candidatus Kapabacteria bacterium]|jgi:2-iminobutanoate/2-iminopropanoate deaminase